MTDLTGILLGNRYILLEKIGEGGMALVYKAKDQLLNRFVAIKILRLEYTTDEDFVKKFKRESLAAASLSHPNIVNIYDVGEQDNIYYIVMEYIHGDTLKDYIKKCGKLTYLETLNITEQIAAALEHAHSNNVVHRDIKPHNIMITKDKVIKVMDFGIARASSSSTMTNTSKVLGSVHYFSPEQARGGYTDNRTDIYSLGVVMYEMLTGVLPFDAESPVCVAIKHIQETFIQPIEVDPCIPQAINDIVMKCMQKDLNTRYQSASDLIHDIRTAIKNPDTHLLIEEKEDQYTKVIPVEEIDAALKSEKDKKKKPNKKKKGIIIASVTTVLVLIAVLIALKVNSYLNVKDVKIPVIIGKQESEAEEILRNNNLNPVVTNSTNSEKPAGEVIRVSPEEGLTVKENSTVNITLSLGPEKTTVPSLIGLTKDDAIAKLKDSGLTLGNPDNPDRKTSDTIKKDLIMDQDPHPDSEADKGSSVKIVISDGKEIQLTQVPLLTGETLAEASQTLNAYNLKLSTTIKYGNNSTYVNGVVIDQDVAAGTQVQEWSVIKVTLNKKHASTIQNTPEPTEEPLVTDTTEPSDNQGQ